MSIIIKKIIVIKRRRLISRPFKDPITMKQLLVITLITCFSIPIQCNKRPKYPFSNSLIMALIGLGNKTIASTHNSYKTTITVLHEIGEEVKDVGVQIKDTFK